MQTASERVTYDTFKYEPAIKGGADYESDTNEYCLEIENDSAPPTDSEDDAELLTKNVTGGNPEATIEYGTIVRDFLSFLAKSHLPF